MEKDMERKIAVKASEMEVVDGKVVISSEELAAAVLEQENIGAEDEAEAIFAGLGCINF